MKLILKKSKIVFESEKTPEKVSDNTKLKDESGESASVITYKKGAVRTGSSPSSLNSCFFLYTDQLIAGKEYSFDFKLFCNIEGVSFSSARLQLGCRTEIGGATNNVKTEYVAFDSNGNCHITITVPSDTVYVTELRIFPKMNEGTIPEGVDGFFYVGNSENPVDFYHYE